MESYKFGGNRIKRFASRLLSMASKGICGVNGVYLWVAKKLNKVSVKVDALSFRLKKESSPKVIHITRIVPLDKWSTRIEFTVNRRDKNCLHIYSESGDYSDIFAEYKRGNNVEPTEAFYFMVSGLIKNWKQM